MSRHQPTNLPVSRSLLAVLATALTLCAPTLSFALVITEEQLAELGDKKFAVREAMTQTLLADETIGPSSVVKAYRLAKYPEQRMRLQLIARQQYIVERRIYRNSLISG